MAFRNATLFARKVPLRLSHLNVRKYKTAIGIYFKPPAARPSIKRRCKNRNNIITGNITMTPAASVSPQ
jgi:hypothetical protein